MEMLLRNFRYALRGLIGAPAFTAAVVATLGIGIGACTAMFGVVDALLLRPLPYGEPGELAHVWTVSPKSGGENRFIAWEEATVWREQAPFPGGALPHARGTVLYTGGGEPRTLGIEAVTPNFEEVLRVRPSLGRGFVEADAEPGADPVAVIDHGFWRSAFGADPGVIGQRLELDGVRHRVIGVMPAGFKFPTYSETELWLPILRDGTVLGRQVGWVEVLARTGSGSSELAQARADVFAGALAEETQAEAGWSARLLPMQEMRSRNTDLLRAMWFLAGAVGLILLIAVVNAVTLLLVRGSTRTRELAVRTALGASRARLVGQLLTESLLLALLSGAVAVVFAMVSLAALRGAIPDSIIFFAPHLIEVQQRVLVFTAALAAGAGLLVGLVPALQSTRRGALIAEAGLTPYAGRTPARSHLRKGLVVGAVAVSVMLLFGAGLLINSFVRLTRVDPGYRIEELAIMDLSLSPASYPSSEARGTFLNRLEERLEALPGVEQVTAPGGGYHDGVALEAEGQSSTGAQPSIIPFSTVSPDYFEVLEVPVRAGRPFLADDAGTDNVVVDENLARFLWGDQNPVGRRFRIRADSPWLTVVGVIGDLRLMGPDARSGNYEILYPSRSAATPAYIQLAIRTRGHPAVTFPSIRAGLYQLDPRQPIVDLRPATQAYAEFIEMPRFLLLVVSVLSAIALLLAAVGIHGILAYTVARRQHELGVRIALGAAPDDLANGMLREGMALAAVGVAAGITGALPLSPLVRGLLYGVGPHDPGNVAVVAVVTLAAAAVASWIPARRATRVDPMVALRTD